MGREDWYRKKTWTPRVRAAFEARLGRARSGRPEYLRIQALSLAHADDPDALEGALDLAGRCLRDFPDHSLGITQLHATRATALEKLGRTSEALVEWREAIASQRARPMCVDFVQIEFAEFVLRLGRQELYQEALLVLRELAGLTRFRLPDEAFREAAAEALLAHDLGEFAVARQRARAALEAASRTSSGLPYHKSLGVVDRSEAGVDSTLRALRRIAGARRGREP